MTVEPTRFNSDFDDDRVNSELMFSASLDAAGINPDAEPISDEPSIPALTEPEGRTDLANSRRLVRAFGDRLRYCHPWGKWLLWDGTRWAVDTDAGAERLAKEIADRIWAASNQIDDKDVRKWACYTAQRRAIVAMLALAASDVPIAVDDMDANEWLLNCPNGTLDLRTGELRMHRREDYITRLCPTEYHSGADATVWGNFQLDVTGGDSDLVAYKQRLMGYCLTGDVREQILPIAWGTGSNGKSTEIDALMTVIGDDYCGTLPRSLLTTNRGEHHPTELTTLHGKRLVIAHETDDGGRLSEALVKQLTGGDAITARGMREDFWTFRPTHKILLATNHKPEVRGTDLAIWRRLKLIPYAIKFEGGRIDKAMWEKLERQRQGILAWLVQGCLAWQREGLGEPAAVNTATAAYRTAQDVLAGFFDECCVIGQPAFRVRASDLYRVYKNWAERSGEFAQNQRKFGEAMTERGYRRIKNDGMWYVGVGLIDTLTERTE